MSIIDRIGGALLLEPMTVCDIALMLHLSPKIVGREIRHLLSSGYVATRHDRCAELRPIYYLTRRGRDWAEGWLSQQYQPTERRTEHG